MLSLFSALRSGAGFFVWRASRLVPLKREPDVPCTRRGGVAAGPAGLVGVRVLEVNCANVNVFHVLVWHWGVIVIGSLAGLAFGALGERVERRIYLRDPGV